MTAEEILAEVQAALARSSDELEDAYTTREWSKLMGVSVRTATNRLADLLDDGRMECRRVQRTSRDGITRWHTVYRLLPDISPNGDD